MPGLEEELIADILLGSPGHLPGTRPIHAPGIAATGWFEATGAARRYTRAPHFDGNRVPVTVRFSDGTGLPFAPSSKPVIRGMAVKFHHPTGEIDMIGVTAVAFFCRTIDLFREFSQATTPVKVKRRAWWAKLLDNVTLNLPPPEPTPGTIMSNDAGVFAFANLHPESAPAVTSLGAPVPESYCACCYRPIHAFKLTDADDVVSYVRFQWDPVVGVRAAEDTSANFLQSDLRNRVKQDRAEFVLRAQVAEQGDDPVDVTRPWSQHRRRVVMGHLVLTAIPDDQINGCERLRFDPTRLPDGIGFHPDDEIMKERGKVYPVSFEARRDAWPSD